MSLVDLVQCAAILLVAVAFLMHINKEAKDAHGKARK